MLIEILIARWVAVFWVVVGLSHVLHPATWVALLLPLRERDTGGFLLAAMNLPIGLAIVLGHNIWVWDVPVIVTLAGWIATIKGVVYLLFPRAHMRIMSTAGRLEKGIRVGGAVIIVLGIVVGYDAFFRR
ncbi:MAG: hypothetical protein WD738_08070 [Pirellulales bacterium]